MPDPAGYALASLLDCLLKGFLIFSLALALDLLLQRASASLRHMIWATGLTLSILLPIISSVVPRLNAPFLPIGFLVPFPVAQGDSAGTGGGLSMNAPGIFVCVYIVGVLLVLAWQLLGRIYAARLRKHASLIEDEELLRAARRLLSEQGIRASVELLASGMARIPFSTGFVRPAIVLPDGWRSWPRPVLESVLIHELGHVRRRDCLTRVAAQLGCCVHWINPLAWFGLRRVIMEQEIACDILVVGSGTKPSTYARSLIALAKARRNGLMDGVTALGRRAELQNRLLEILKPRRSRTPLRVRGSLAFLAVAVALILPISALNVCKVPASEAFPAVRDVALAGSKLPNQAHVNNLDPAAQVAAKALQESQFSKEYILQQIQKMKAEGAPEAKITAFTQKAKAKLADIEKQKKLIEKGKKEASSRPERSESGADGINSLSSI